MSDLSEEARFREHLGEMRRAARGLGHDFSMEFKDLDRKIERFGRSSGRDASRLGQEIQDSFANLGKKMDADLRELPGLIAEGAMIVGGTTRDAFVAAGKRTREGTRNVLASAAGVNRRPIKTWSPPAEDDAPER
jgi:hypothetical protein